MDIHFSNNALSIFVLSISGELNGMALFDWKIDPKSPLVALSIGLYSILMIVIYKIGTRKYSTAKN